MSDVDTCEDCEQPTSSIISCTTRQWIIGGKYYTRLSYLALSGAGPCGGCCTPTGGTHHFPCLYEKCPVCKENIVECPHASEVIDSFGRAEGVEEEKQITSADVEPDSVTLEQYVKAMKVALDKFSETRIKQGKTGAQGLGAWSDDFVDYLDGED